MGMCLGTHTERHKLVEAIRMEAKRLMALDYHARWVFEQLFVKCSALMLQHHSLFANVSVAI